LELLLKNFEKLDTQYCRILAPHRMIAMQEILSSYERLPVHYVDLLIYWLELPVSVQRYTLFSRE
jgi:hypothetical protein